MNRLIVTESTDIINRCVLKGLEGKKKGGKMEENPDPKPSGTTGKRFLDFNHAPKQGRS